MIKVSVENFQSIESADIEIDGFTVVTGKNNSGKSALLRSINSVFTNALGSSFVRSGEDYCQVSIDFGNDQTVRWRKGDKVKPTYWINGGEPIHSGRNAPTELEQFGIAPINANGRELWCQIAPQFTGQVFLIDMPGSVMAEIVADVDRVSDLNSALKNCEKDKRSNSSILKVRNQDHEKLSKEREKYDDVEDRVQEYKHLDYQREHLQDLRNRIEKIHTLREKLNTNKQSIFALSGIISELSVLSDLEEIVNGILETESKITTYEKLGRRYRSRSRECRSLLGVDTLIDPSLDKLKSARNQLKTLSPLYDRKIGAEKVIGAISDLGDCEIPTTDSIKQHRDQLKIIKELSDRKSQSERDMRAFDELSQIEIPTFGFSSDRLQALHSVNNSYKKDKNSVYILEQKRVDTEKELGVLTQSIAQKIQEHGECPFCGE